MNLNSSAHNIILFFTGFCFLKNLKRQLMDWVLAMGNEDERGIRLKYFYIYVFSCVGFLDKL